MEHLTVESALALADATPQGSGAFLAKLVGAGRAAGLSALSILAWVATHAPQVQKAVTDILAGADAATIIADLLALMQQKGA